MIGETIRTTRLAKGITQSDLAGALQVTKAAVSLYELGQRRLKPEQLLTIADLLGVPVCDLLEVSTEKRQEIEEAQDIIFTMDGRWESGQMQGDQDEWVWASRKFLEELVKRNLSDAIASDGGKSSTGDAPESKLPKKRLDELLLLFGQLNDNGQKSAIRHIRELAQVPAYQAQPHPVGFSPDEQQAIEAALDTIKNAKYDLDTMDSGQMTPGKARTLASSAKQLSNATDCLIALLFEAQCPDGPENSEE